MELLLLLSGEGRKLMGHPKCPAQPEDRVGIV